jgi:hypothetical protein
MELSPSHLAQVPWRALQSRPVVLHLSDVWLCASPRAEEDWEEDLAGQRAQAAKQAELAAMELVRSSGRNGTASHDNSGLASAFLSHLGTILLNRLQMTIRNIHVCFKVRDKKHNWHSMNRSTGIGNMESLLRIWLFVAGLE